MSLVIVRDLSLSFGARALFSSAGFTLGAHDRVGLVGANGTGKSTLLKILAGHVSPDGGAVQFSRGVRPGYLPQDVAALPAGTLVGGVLAAVPGREELEERLLQLERALAEATEVDQQVELAQGLADLHFELEHFEERFGRHRAEAILLGLGFEERDFEREMSTLSGGWRMRAALASLLLQDPPLLLLDEPTNHLDLPTLEWFDAFLKRSRKALVLISHDRDFLNRQINRVLSLELEGLRSWVGNYNEYRRLREEEVEQLAARAARQEVKRAQTEAFIDRFRAKASKARQVQSRIKLLEREQAIEVRQERATVSFRFPEAERSGREVVTLKGLRKSYGNTVVYEGLNALVLRDQRIAVVGRNGAGKSTLLKLVAGELSPEAGTVSLGHNVTVGYYAQHHAESLDPRATILEEISRLVPDRPPSFLRGVLGAFLFSGDDVDKPIGVLSGGERARVALAKLLVKPANFLIMDEPTNHLDLDSSEALIAALREYRGTILFVSHNRSFLNQLATDVWDVRDRTAAPYPGNLDDYLYHLRQAQEAWEEAPQRAEGERPASEKERRRAEAEARQQRSALEGPIKRRIAELETQIGQLEAGQREREAQLADPVLYDDFTRARPLMEAHRLGKEELDRLYAAWEEASERLAKV